MRTTKRVKMIIFSTMFFNISISQFIH